MVTVPVVPSVTSCSQPWPSRTMRAVACSLSTSTIRTPFCSAVSSTLNSSIKALLVDARRAARRPPPLGKSRNRPPAESPKAPEKRRNRQHTAHGAYGSTLREPDGRDDREAAYGADIGSPQPERAPVRGRYEEKTREE